MTFGAGQAIRSTVTPTAGGVSVATVAEMPPEPALSGSEWVGMTVESHRADACPPRPACLGRLPMSAPDFEWGRGGQPAAGRGRGRARTSAEKRWAEARATDWKSAARTGSSLEAGWGWAMRRLACLGRF